jgi:lycopene cyclase CruA
MTTRPDLAALRASHPRTVAAFEAMGAAGQLCSVAALDERWAQVSRGHLSHSLHRRVDRLPEAEGAWDLIYAGGGLGLLHALVMCRHGYRVLIFDRDEVGRAHREWNVSDSELRVLARLGIFDEQEVEQVVAHRHARGVVRFHAETVSVQPAELWMDHVLDVSLDAAELLRLLRRKLEAAGGDILDHSTLGQVLAGPDGVVVELTASDGTRRRLRGRLLLDGMGATSPLAMQRFNGQPFAGVCPTVGSTVTGLEPGCGPGRHDPSVGDILISVADAQNGHQLIWEGFAGREGSLTVYVFYYDLVPGAERHSLLDLFEDYFALLPTYKVPGPEFRHVKPVFGFIPARHTQRRTPVLPLAGVLPLGDAAAQQSPLTFTGFGSHLRNLERTTSLLDYALRRNLLDPRALAEISAYQANVALHWVFSRFMQPWRRPNDVNQLQNVFARVLNELGTDVAARFFKDRMRWRDYGRIVNHTLKIYKPIIPTAIEVLGPRGTIRWIADYLRFSRAALLATCGRLLEEQQWYILERIADRVAPRRALWLKSRRAEWRAMGWLAE